jgi:hypothetical protein
LNSSSNMLKRICKTFFIFLCSPLYFRPNSLGSPVWPLIFFHLISLIGPSSALGSLGLLAHPAHEPHHLPPPVMCHGIAV